MLLGLYRIWAPCCRLPDCCAATSSTLVGPSVPSPAFIARSDRRARGDFHHPNDTRALVKAVAIVSFDGDGLYLPSASKAASDPTENKTAGSTHCECEVIRNDKIVNVMHRRAPRRAHPRADPCIRALSSLRSLKR
jgi:hypothetical protein